MPGLLLEMDSNGIPIPKTPEYGFMVSHQKVDLEIDFSTQTLSGRSVLTILPQKRDLTSIRIDARQCEIKDGGVMVNDRAAEHEFEDPMAKMDMLKKVAWGVEQHGMQTERIKPLTEDTRALGALIIDIPKTVRVEEVDPFSDGAASAVTQRALGASAAKTSSFTAENGNGPLSATPVLTPKTAAEQSARFQPLFVSIAFETKKWRDGLQWVGLGENDSRFPHVYSKHSIDPGSASCIFPCVDDPAMRCTWEISVKCSRTLGDALKRKPQKEHGVHHLLHKKNLPNGVVSGVVDEYEVPLSDEEKLLEMTVVCSGELINEITDLEDSSKKVVSFLVGNIVAPQHIGLAIGPFEQVDLSEYREVEDDEKLGQGQTLPVMGFCLPGRADEVRHTCTPMAHALDYFLLNFGSYPFTDCRFVFVDDQLRDIEHTASLSICSNRLLFSEDIIDPELDNVRTLVHAIASQWIGVSIIPNQRCDRWVTIGLSHFMTGLFMKSLCGHNEYAFRQKELTDRLVEEDIQRPGIHALGETLHLGQFEMDFMVLKAPLVLFILDKRIVKASGSAGLTRVLSRIVVTANTGTAADSVMSTEGFRRLCEKITKYRQTESFWNQWVLGAGCPRFTITQKFNKKRLCVEMIISQKQDKLIGARRTLEKASFKREIKEDIHGVYAGDIQPVFTGPLTIRIHEADGTPYEHIVEIREGHAKIEIPYNTKYKRLKRNRRQKERQNAGAVDISEVPGEDALYYCLGDVLTSPTDIKEWALSEWSTEQDQKMEQESYEWIRVDADFEWLCEKHFIGMESYMYVSQLQQDRDVVAQHEAMLFLGSCGPHPLVATFLIRTLMDPRYFHGIRTMAAKYLKTHANKACHMIGIKHLEKAYQEFFCYPGQKMPRSNDFSDKRTYQVEKAIASSLSQIRISQPESNKLVCPKEARQALLDMLRFNDNTNNEFSDNFKVTNLLSALANSLIPIVDENNVLNKEEKSQESNDAMDGVITEENSNNQDAISLSMGLPVLPVIDREPAEFQKAVLEELDRYRRMDEWINSYHNSFTVTVLECKQRLMKAKVIPMDPIEFAQYLHDGTSDYVRIKAFDALVDLGYLKNEGVLRLLLNTLSTDPSPYTRNHLFEIFCLGLATIAFGDTKLASLSLAAPKPENPDSNAAANGDMLVDGVAPHDNDGLIVEQDISLDSRKAAIDRISSIDGALAALKEELKDNQVLRDSLWKAISSDRLDLGEQIDLLDLCYILYEAVESMVVELKLPRYWKARYLGKGIVLFKHTKKLRTKALRPYIKPQPSTSIPAPVPPTIQSMPSVRLSISTGAGKQAITIKQPQQEIPIPVKQPPPSTITLKPPTVTTGMKPSTVTTGTKSSTVTTGTKSSTVTTGTKSSTITTGTKSSNVTTGMKSSNVTTGMKSSNVTTGMKPSTVTTGMKPPTSKRPLERTASFEAGERPRKIVKLRVSSAKVEQIQSRAPTPTLARSKSVTKSASPAPRPSPAPKASPVQTTSATASSTIIASPSPNANRRPLPEGRKPLPEGRKPLPGQSAISVEKSQSAGGNSSRKPLPGTPASASASRKPLPTNSALATASPVQSVTAPVVDPTLPARPRLMIKLNTKSGFNPGATRQ